MAVLRDAKCAVRLGHPMDLGAAGEQRDGTLPAYGTLGKGVEGVPHPYLDRGIWGK